MAATSSPHAVSLVAAEVLAVVGTNNDSSKKVAWNKASSSSKSNVGPDSGPVVMAMGPLSWPTLSESAKVSPKPPSPHPPPRVVTATVYSSPATSPSSAPQRQMTTSPNSPNPSANQHHVRPVRQRSTRREGEGNSPSNGGFFPHQPPQSSSSLDGNVSTAEHGASDGTRREHGHNYAYREGGQRDYHSQRSYRRSNSGPHLRGDGSFGGRRDQDRGNHDWIHQRSLNGRGPVRPQQRGGPRGFVRPPPPGAAPYVPPPMQPYNNPMGIPPEMQPPYYFQPQPGMPFFAQIPHAGYFPPPDPQLPVKIINQIDYYFSNGNLIKDTYLRQNMDEQGWVPIQLIARFNKVRQLTTNNQLILDSLRASAVVEIQGDKVRKRDDWMRWILPPSVQLPTASGSQSPRMPGPDTLVTHVQGLAIDENSARSSSGDVYVHRETSKDGRDSSVR